jgi:hypothetical protein
VDVGHRGLVLCETAISVRSDADVKDHDRPTRLVQTSLLHHMLGVRGHA